jgi:tRNA (pseudouridine54-N1)-methyltransferase
MRAFCIVGHTAPTNGNFSLNDLPGSAGRIDVLCRFVQATLFLSHSIRQDTDCFLVLLGEPTPPKTILLRGSEVRFLNPDERSTAALLKRALSLPVGSVFRPSTPGIYVRATGLPELIAEHVFALAEEKGSDLRAAATLPSAVLFSDHRNFTEEEQTLLSDLPRYSVGPCSLHADHAVTLFQNELDRRDAGWE